MQQPEPIKEAEYANIELMLLLFLVESIWGGRVRGAANGTGITRPSPTEPKGPVRQRLRYVLRWRPNDKQMLSLF